MTSVKVSKHSSGLSAIVLKAMGLFGGLQIVGILSSIIRTKFVALWLGPAGVALFGIYNVAVEMISSATQLNLRNTSVREIAVEASKGSSISVIVNVVKKWAWILGLFGSVVMLVFASLLSRWTFGNESHTMAYIWLSVVMLLSSLTGGESAILQGTQRLKKLASASVWGTVGGTVFSIPLFYFFRLDSIIPSIIIYTLTNLVAVMWVRYKPDDDIYVPLSTVLKDGRNLIVLGSFLTVSAFVTQLSSYIFMAYLNNVGGEDAVGFYQSGFTLVNRYLGLIFTAIAMEYFPRLSSVSASLKRMSVYVNHETLIVLVAMIPASILFIALRGVIVNIFLSSEFDVIHDYISWGAVGSILRGMSWCMSYAILVRGDGKCYLFTELSSCLLYLLFSYAGFSLYGIDGLGYAYFLWYLGYAIIVGFVCRKRYDIRLSRPILFMGIGGIALSAAAAIFVSYNSWIVLAAGIVVTYLSFRKVRSLLRCKS